MRCDFHLNLVHLCLWQFDDYQLKLTAQTRRICIVNTQKNIFSSNFLGEFNIILGPNSIFIFGYWNFHHFIFIPNGIFTNFLWLLFFLWLLYNLFGSRVYIYFSFNFCKRLSNFFLFSSTTNFGRGKNRSLLKIGLHSKLVLFHLLIGHEHAFQS